MERNPDCVKSVYRQGLANAGLNHTQKATACFLKAGQLSPEDPNPARQLLKLVGGLRNDVEFTMQLLKRFVEFPKYQQLAAEHMHDVLTGVAARKEKEDAAKHQAAAAGGSQMSPDGSGAGGCNNSSDSENDGDSSDDEDEDRALMKQALRLAEFMDCGGLAQVRRLVAEAQPVAVRQAGVRLFKLIADHHDPGLPEADLARLALAEAALPDSQP